MATNLRWYFFSCNFVPSHLTHWGRVMHTSVTIIGSDNGLSSGRRQVVIWTNAGILLSGPSGTNFNESSIEIHTFSFKKNTFENVKKCCPFRLGLNVLSELQWITKMMRSRCSRSQNGYQVACQSFAKKAQLPGLSLPPSTPLTNMWQFKLNQSCSLDQKIFLF